MLFNSIPFLIFFPCVWVLYVSQKHRFQNVLLLLASYFFYGCWDWRFLSLLWISTIVDFLCGLGMARIPKRKVLFLRISLLTNLGILGVFKYFDFFVDSAAGILQALGFHADYATLGLILPVGISFYTFQTMAYSIDVYRGRQEPTRDLLSFAIYVAYFPQLVAGPIERSEHLLPQLQQKRRVQLSDLMDGAELCLMGYFKKVFIADGVAPYVSHAFSSSDSLGSIGLLVGVYLFALQIYGDFSGYSDIARGVSRFFGIRLCVNFAQPYLSTSITEFWRRWHISLSTWLRDYLYIPLGGNRKGNARTYWNNLVTMLLGGLWHGAAWTFIVWGGLHGLYLAVHKLLLRGQRVQMSSPPKQKYSILKWAFGCFATFNMVCLAWIFFRAESFPQAIQYATGIFSGKSGDLSISSVVVLVFYGFSMLIIDLLCYFQGSEIPLQRNCPAMVKGVVYGTMFFLILCLGEQDAQPFIYFQF